jgi:hypothetical protein
MTSIREAASQSLISRPAPGAEGEFELLSGSEVLGTLRWENRFSLTVAEAAEGKWTFKRTGFFHPKVTVRKASDDMDLATYTPAGVQWPGMSSSHMIEFAGGRKFLWASADAFSSEWTFKGASGEPLIQIKPGPDKKSSEVLLTPAGLALPEASLLILLGSYVMLLVASERAAGMGAVVGIMAGLS